VISGDVCVAHEKLKIIKNTSVGKYMKDVRDQIVFIAPPLAISNSPYISIPVLMGWLAQNKIPCSFIDLNRQLVSHLLSDTKRIRNAYKYICEVFVELNGKTALNPAQANQIGQLQMLLRRLSPIIDFLEDSTEILNLNTAESEVLLELISAPFWPNSLLKVGELQFRSKYSDSRSKSHCSLKAGV